MAVAEVSQKKLTAIQKQQLLLKEIEAERSSLALIDMELIEEPEQNSDNTELAVHNTESVKYLAVFFVTLFSILLAVFFGSLALGFIVKTADPLNYAVTNLYYSFKAATTLLLLVVAQLFFVAEIVYQFLSNHLATLINNANVKVSLDYALLPEPYSGYDLIIGVIILMALVYYCARRALCHFSKVLWRVVLCFSVLAIVYFNLDIFQQKNAELIEFLNSDKVSVKL